MYELGKRLSQSGWQVTYTDLKRPIIGLFGAASAIAFIHGLMHPVVTPHYWITLGSMLCLLVVASGVNWFRTHRLWRLPVQLLSLAYASAMLYWGLDVSYTPLLFILPLGVAGLFMQGAPRLVLQGLAVLVGAYGAMRLTGGPPWEWLAILLTAMLGTNWMIDRTLEAIRREIRRVRRFRVISETTKALLQRTDEGLLDECCQQALVAFGASQCVLFVASPDRTLFVTQAMAFSSGFHAHPTFLQPAPIDGGITGWVAATGEAVMTGDVARHPRAVVPEGADVPGSAMFLPVLADDGSVQGVLRLYKPGRNQFSPEDFDLAKVWAVDVGLVLQKAELYRRLEKMAHTDALTGTYNRHYLTQRWPEVIAESARTGTPVALLMLDCFNFKQINDRYGHIVGDQLLQELGKILVEVTPPGGLTVRYGGDEFLVVLPTGTRDDAEMLREEIQQRLSLVGVARPELPSLTVDVGVYAATGCELNHLLTRVDMDLYEERDQTNYQRMQALLETSVSERSKHMLQAVMSLAKIQEMNDPYTRGHSERAKEIATRTARRLGMSPEEVQVVGFGAILHDVGKIVVPPEILNKPAPLTEDEWRIMRMHPVFGANIVGELDSLKQVKPLILHHHERFDGVVVGKHPGYPAGLKGETIPLGARIIAVVDTFDAMTTDRVYRKGRPTEVALAELRRMAGLQFDPAVVEAFEQVIAETEQERTARGAGMIPATSPTGMVK